MKKLILATIVLLFALQGLSQSDFTTNPRFTFFEMAIGSHKIESNQSAIYDFNAENLTFNPSSLDDLDLSLGMYWQNTNLIAYGIMLRQFDSSVLTEDKDYVYENGSPIFQTIGLEKTYIGFDAIITPFGAGEKYGTRAWAPKTIVPYLRVGAGFMDWSYTEEGDFVDYETLDIYNDQYVAGNTDLGVQLGIGCRFMVSPRTDLRIEYNYTKAEGGMDGNDFQGFGDLNLSSKTASIGISIKFF